MLRVDEPGHRMFRTPARDVHVHVWPTGSPEVGRYLAFRDRLRSSESDRRAYEQRKRELAERDWDDMNHYAQAKGELIEAILRRYAEARGNDTPASRARLAAITSSRRRSDSSSSSKRSA